MKINTITPSFSVSSQLCVDDIGTLKSMGFNAIICNRPDGECAEQATFASIKQAAERQGIVCHYLPVISGAVTVADAQQLRRILQGESGAILAYCRTGARCQMLYSQQQGQASP